MKNIKTILLLLLIITTVDGVFAQDKKIAILETVDKEGNVPYGIRLQLRSNLTYAISNTPGYEGFDRVDMAQIMSEHDFQRTGLVSDEQIRRLGEMSGCSSILVAEAAVYDKDNIIITAKILNVETASVECAVPPTISSTSPQKMQESCVELADKLLAKLSDMEEKSIVPSGFVKELVYNGKDIYGDHSYSKNGQRLTSEQYVDLLKNCPEAWFYYEKGCKQGKTGKTLLIVSGGCVLLAVGGFVYSEIEGVEFSLLGASAGVGAICALVSIPFFKSGANKKKNAYKIYNQYCANPKTTLSFGPTVNGIVVNLNF